MADQKISALTADTTPTSDDITVTVDIGTGANKKATLTNIITKAHGLTDGIVKVATGVMAPATDGTDYISSVAADTTPQLGGNLDAQTNDITNVGSLGATGTRLTKGWFTDLEVTNAIAGSITGNAATVSTITGLAPDTATTQATQANITTCVNLTTVGALAAGSIAAGFGTISTANSIQGTVLVATATASLTLGTASTADGQILLKNATNANTVTIQTGASAADQVYTWPAAVGGAGTVLTDVAGNGVLSWAAAGGGNTLDQAYDQGGAGAGRTITADTGAVAISATAEALDIDSTATTQTILDVTGSSLTTGKLARFYSNSADANGRNLVEIVNDNTAASNAIALTVQQDAAKDALYINHSGNGGLAVNIATNNGNAYATWITSASATTTSSTIISNALTSGKGINNSSTSNAITTGELFAASLTSSGITANKTGNLNSMTSSRTLTAAATRSDDCDTLLVSRTSVANNAGGTFNAAGSVLKLSNVNTETAGTMDSTAVSLEIAHQSHSDSALVWAVSITSDNTGTGGTGGIDLSSMSAAEPILNVVADTTAIGAHYGRIAVNVQGVGVKYLELFEAS